MDEIEATLSSLVLMKLGLPMRPLELLAEHLHGERNLCFDEKDVEEQQNGPSAA